MVEPRYLKLWVNFTNWVFGRAMVDGREFSEMSFFASFRELGKNMASVFDLVFCGQHAFASLVSGSDGLGCL